MTKLARSVGNITTITHELGVIDIHGRGATPSGLCRARFSPSQLWWLELVLMAL